MEAAPIRGGSSDRTGVPILPPSCASRPADASRCAISAVVVDLPLVPVMATNGASGTFAARSRQNISMSPMISTPAASARLHRPVRLGMGQRHARRQHQRGEAAPVGAPEIDDRDALGRGRRHAVSRLSSQAATIGAAGGQRRGGAPAAAEAEDGDLPSSEARGRDQGAPHLIFSVERPIRASITATIQKRMTICALGPADLLEVMVDRRHLEDALAQHLERERPG